MTQNLGDRTGKGVALQRNVGALLLRTTVGGLMLFHGLDKVKKGVGGMGEMLVENGLPAVMAYGVYAGEVVAPVLFLLGIAMRTSAAAMAFTMAMAVYLLHPGDLFALTPHGGYALELHTFYAVGALTAALIGPGKFAVPVPAWLERL